MTKEEAYRYIDNLKWLKGYDNTTIGGKTVGEILDEIKDMLKEQEARNIIVEERRALFDDSGDEAKYGEDIFYHCPSCNRILSRTHMNKNIHFCEECGTEVKWE